MTAGLPAPQTLLRRLLVRASCACLAACAASASASRAGTQLYSFEFPDRVDAVYELAFDVAHAGRVLVDARWGSGRILSFRLEGPGERPVRVLRSGPSPQRIETTASEISSPRTPWRLVVRALPGRGASQVALSIEVADAPVPVPAPAPRLEASEPSVKLEPWAEPAKGKAAGDARLAPLFASVERFRASIVAPDGRFADDPCSWHTELLRRVVALRDALAAGAFPLGDGERASLTRIAAAVRRVDEIRRSDDPLLAGPVPSNASERIVWRARRGDRFRPLEEELDALLQDSRQASFWSVREDLWPARVAACLIACERYFEERVRIGDEAANAELAKGEWDRYLEIAQVFEAIATASVRPGTLPQPAQ